jgi:hypothetical protein
MQIAQHAVASPVVSHACELNAPHAPSFAQHPCSDSSAICMHLPFRSIRAPTIPTDLRLPKKSGRWLTQLISKERWTKGGVVSDSSSVILGISNSCTGPRFTADTAKHVDLIRELNRVLRATLVLSGDSPYVWTSFAIEINTIQSARHLPFCTGPAFSFALGNHRGFAQIDGVSVPLGRVVSHSSSSPCCLPEFEGYRVVVTAFCSTGAAELLRNKGDEARLMSELSFRPSIEYCNVDTTGSEGKEKEHPRAAAPGGSLD